MKKIEAVIRKDKLDAVKNALSEHGLLHGMSVAEVHAAGGEVGPQVVYRGNVVPRPYLPRLKLELVASDDEAGAAVECIFDAAYTGEVGDGKIFVGNVDHVYRIRTGEEVNDLVSSPLSVAR